MIAVDQTTPEQHDLGLATASVVVPGLLPIDFGWMRQRAPHARRLRTAFRSRRSPRPRPARRRDPLRSPPVPVRCAMTPESPVSPTRTRPRSCAAAVIRCLRSTSPPTGPTRPGAASTTRTRPPFRCRPRRRSPPIWTPRCVAPERRRRAVHAGAAGRHAARLLRAARASARHPGQHRPRRAALVRPRQLAPRHRLRRRPLSVQRLLGRRARRRGQSPASTTTPMPATPCSGCWPVTSPPG